MLDIFRENARSWVIQLIIAALSLVFIFSFGVGSKGFETGPGEAGWAAEVNGHEVPTSAFNQMLQQNVYYRSQAGNGQYTNAQAKADRLREKTMDQVVDQELVAQAALNAGLWVDNAAIVRNVQKNPMFQRNGVFDKPTYVRYVENAEGLSPAMYEARLRRALLTQRMFQLAQASLAVSDDEIQEEFLKEHEAASIEYVRFTPAQFRGQVKVSDAEIDQALKTRRAEIAKKYEDQKFLYEMPEEMKVERLFAPVAQNATPAEEAAAKKQVEDAKKALDAGKPWVKVAQGFTQDPAATDQQGDIGWVQMGRSPFGEDFENAVFQLKPGETSGVVRDHFGYSIIHALERRKAYEKKLADVQRGIAKALLATEKAKALAQGAAESALAKLKAGTALDQLFPPAPVAKKSAQNFFASAPVPLTPSVATTSDFHPYGGIIPQLGSVPNVVRAAFSLDATHRVPDHLIVDQGAYWVIDLRSRERADLSQLPQEKDQLRTELIGEKQSQLLERWVKTLHKGASIEPNPEMLSYAQQPNGYSNM